MIKIKTGSLAYLPQTAILLSSLVLGLLSSCQVDSGPDVPDVSGMEIDFDFRRFDRDLFQLDTGARFGEELTQLERKYDEFANIYFQYILGSRNPEQAPQGHEAFVRGFVTHPSVRTLYDTTKLIFGDLTDYRTELERALRWYHYYFPDRNIPSVTTYLSEFGLQGFIYGDDDLAIGLDFFLGEDFPYRSIDPLSPNFSDYLTRTYNRDHLPLKTLQPLAGEVFKQAHGSRLLEVMIQKGKQLYLLDQLLPHAPDTVIMEVSREQWDWLESHELEIWSYFLNETDKSSNQSLLYSSDWATFRKFVEYSPHSPGMPPKAPGRTACYLGWKIVSAWVDQKAPRDPMQSLLARTDAQKLLEESRYKPSRIQ